MSKDLRLNLILGHLETLTAPLKKIQGGSGQAAAALREQRQQLNQLQKQQRDISSFKKIQAATQRSSGQLGEARDSVKALQKQLEATEKPSKKLINQFDRATKTAQQLEKQHKANRSKLIGIQKAIKDAGGSTRKLAEHEKKLAASIQRTNTQLEKQKQKLDQVNRRQKQMAKLRSHFDSAKSKAGSLLAQTTVAGAGLGYFFKTQFLDKAAQFEDFEAVLRSVEGSSTKAKQAMNWVSDFAATTPYELAEVTEAYKQLRAYGMDPTTGLLKDLGDTASAMNKPMLQAVEAIADAVTGENERLKEFGIRANVNGQNIIYEYTDKMGRQRREMVDKNNRAEIESTLRTIWNKKYSGAMDERSKTWRGMVSNLSDQWTRFAVLVMENGLFDWMKGKLGALLDKVNQMAADGSLQAYAEEVGQKLVNFATALWEVSSAIANVLTWVADLVGGWENLIYTLAGLKVASLLASLGSMAGALMGLAGIQLPAVMAALKALVVFLATNPIGWAIMAIGAAGAVIMANWETMGPFFENLWLDIKSAFSNGILGVTKLLASWSPMGLIVRAYKGLWDMASDYMGDSEEKIKSHNNAARVKNYEPIRMASRSGGAGATHIGKIEVRPSPGMNEQQLAQLVAQEVQRAQHRRAVSARSNLQDED